MECYGASSCSFFPSSLGLHPVGTLKPAKWGWFHQTHIGLSPKGDHLGHVSRYIRYMMGIDGENVDRT